MKRLGIFGLVVLSAVVVMGGFATGALASPTYYECAKAAQVGKVYTGKYNNSTCTEVNESGTGKFELEPGRDKDKAFKAAGGAATFTTPELGDEFKCSGSKEEGFVSSSFTGQEDVILTFTKCVMLGKNCTSAGAVKGEIVSNSLAGTLGYISKTGPDVGVALAGEGGVPIAEFNCEGLEWVMHGSVIGVVTGNINIISKTSTDSYKVGEGLQIPHQFEGGPTQEIESLVNGSGPFPTGLETTIKGSGEALEIKA